MKVFMSYAAQDRKTAKKIANRLSRAGFTVWWDQQALSGEEIASVLDDEIATAQVIIVLWSTHSISSYWVKSHARTGLETSRLISVRIDEAIPPHPFNQMRTLNLRGWSGRWTSQFKALVGVIREIAGPVMAGQGASRSSPPPPRSRKRRWISIGALASFAIVSLGLIANIGGLISWVNGARADAEISADLESIGSKIETVSKIVETRARSETDELIVTAAQRRLRLAGLPDQMLLSNLFAEGDIDSTLDRMEESYISQSGHMSTQERTDWLHQMAALSLDRDLDRAISLYTQILNIAPNDIAANLEMAYISLIKDDLPKAELYVAQARTYGADTSITSQLKADYIVSFMHYRVYETEQAISLLDDMIRRARQSDSHYYYSAATNLKAMCLFSGCDEGAAISLLEAVRAEQERMGFLSHLAVNYHETGSYYARHEDKVSAFQHLNKAAELFERLGRMDAAATNYEQMAQLAARYDDLEKAEQFASKGLLIAEEHRMPLSRATLLITYSNILKAKGQEEKSCQIWRKAKEATENVLLPQSRLDQLQQAQCTKT